MSGGPTVWRKIRPTSSAAGRAEEDAEEKLAIEAAAGPLGSIAKMISESNSANRQSAAHTAGWPAGNGGSGSGNCSRRRGVASRSPTAAVAVAKAAALTSRRRSSGAQLGLSRRWAGPLLLSLSCMLLVAAAAAASDHEQSLYSKLAGSQADEGQLLASAAAAIEAASRQADHNAPGHYEFEMAPKMEPPSVRKPPYIQSALMCPGSGKCLRAS